MLVEVEQWTYTTSVAKNSNGESCHSDTNGSDKSDADPNKQDATSHSDLVIEQKIIQHQHLFQKDSSSSSSSINSLNALVADDDTNVNKTKNLNETKNNYNNGYSGVNSKTINSDKKRINFNSINSSKLIDENYKTTKTIDLTKTVELNKPLLKPFNSATIDSANNKYNSKIKSFNKFNINNTDLFKTTNINKYEEHERTYQPKHSNKYVEFKLKTKVSNLLFLLNKNKKLIVFHYCCKCLLFYKAS